MRISRAVTIGLMLWVIAILFSACGSPRLKTPTSLSKITLPDFVQSASAEVQEAYRFAVTNPKDLETVPCYCGCSRLGHKSNLDCYLKAVGSDGTLTFDSHAAFCGICVDITRDVMRLRNEGQSAHEIRAYIDAHYSASGPGTDTVMPQG